MPLRVCKHPTCGALVVRGCCSLHAQEDPRAAVHRHYDKYKRDPEAKRFYNSAVWKRVRKKKLAQDPVCQRCSQAWATDVHHTKPLAECTPEEAIDLDMLESLCHPCHTSIEKAGAAA
jgi:hypothetical protein